MVDAAALSSDAEDTATLTETAQYLHDILLVLQNRQNSAKTSKGPTEISIMVAANKLDLFTALPAKLVKKSLESEITKLRISRSKGLLDSGVGMSDDLTDEQEILGGAGEGGFEFKLMEEYNVFVEVVGGNVLGSEGADTKSWLEWFGQQL